MLRTKNPLIVVEHAYVFAERSLIITKIPAARRDVVAGGQRVRMLRTKNPLTNVEHGYVFAERSLIITKIPAARSEVVAGGQRGRMLRTGFLNVPLDVVPMKCDRMLGMSECDVVW